MSENIIKEINNIYERKRNKAFYELVERKKSIYNKIPKLKEIDDEINSSAIQSAKAILISDNTEKDVYVKELEQKMEQLNKEKAQLLSQAKIKPEDLEPQFECSKCRDTGFINNEHCSCYKQQLLNYYYSDSNLQAFKNDTFEHFSIDIYSDQKDPEFNISPKENILNIQKTALDFIENFDNPNQKNLFFTGKTGLGKTFLSSCIANELISQGKTVLYQTAPILLDTMIDYKFNKKEDSEKLYNEILTVDLLIIDDLGVEPLNEIRFAELFTIINTRLLNSKKTTKTIISTNLSLQDLYNRYEERLVSRILGNYNISMFIGEDLRLKNRNKNNKLTTENK